LIAPRAAVTAKTMGSATRRGSPWTDNSPNVTLPTAKVDASEMSISPWTMMGNSPKAIRAKITKNCAELRRLMVSRK
jgi:hypothetical protein